MSRKLNPSFISSMSKMAKTETQAAAMTRLYAKIKDGRTIVSVNIGRRKEKVAEGGE